MPFPGAKKMLQESCVDLMDVVGCQAAHRFCNAQLFEPFVALGYNQFDVRINCYPEDEICYPESGAITAWLNKNSTRKTLGADKAVREYNTVSFDVNSEFEVANDLLYRSDIHVAQLLERGVRILIYVGTTDLACNWVGNARWVEALDWTGHDAFGKLSLRDWSVVDKQTQNGTIIVSGQTKSANGLTFLTIYEAGHMVPYDKPVEAVTMLDRWLDEVPF